MTTVTLGQTNEMSFPNATDIFTFKFDTDITYFEVVSFNPVSSTSKMKGSRHSTVDPSVLIILSLNPKHNIFAFKLFD